MQLTGVGDSGRVNMSLASGLLRGESKTRLQGDKRISRNETVTVKVRVLDVNSMHNATKRRDMLEQFGMSDLDVLGLQETRMSGMGVMEGNGK